MRTNENRALDESAAPKVCSAVRPNNLEDKPSPPDRQDRLPFDNDIDEQVTRALAKAAPHLIPPSEPDFWSPDNPDIVCTRQPLIAVYQNEWGQVVIRQEREWDEEEDTFIIVGPEVLDRLIERLKKLL